MHRLCQFLARKGRDRPAVLAAAGTDLGDDDRIFGMRDAEPRG